MEPLQDQDPKWTEKPEFNYRSGDRPLDGYTIKRGLGAGGFGEVYYALSDGGKEVALKLVRRHLDVEIRGVTQCLNLKSPNLISLFDVRTTPKGESWIIMEFLSGRSLQEILQDHQGALPAAEALRWLAGITRAIDDLHEHGIVHRDLKPGNVFSEGDIVKVGDYGLSKFISNSRRSGQTQSIGTVHYMAPEISTGNYGRSVDVYSAAVMAYEMLCGDVPFDGETAGEILMKHLTAEPDVTRLEQRYRDVFRKALAKNPLDRYQTAGDLFRAIAEAAGVAVATGPIGTPSYEVPRPAPTRFAETRPYRAEELNLSIPPLPGTFAASRRGLGDLIWSMFVGGSVATGMTVLLMAMELILGTNRTPDLAAYTSLTIQSGVAVWGLLMLGRQWSDGKVDIVHRRLAATVLGLIVGVSSVALNAWLVRIDGIPAEITTEWLASDAGIKLLVRPVIISAALFGLIFAIPDWQGQIELKRPLRFNLWHAIVAGVIGMIGGGFVDQSGITSGGVAAVMLTASAVSQWIAPWQPRPLYNPRYASQTGFRTA